MKQTILGLRAETSIHAGTGQNDGVIDLPIQREAHTDYPAIFGSAVKGAFRAHAEVRAGWGDGDKTKEVFGTADGDGSASQISMTDARLLLLPVRALTGHFKLVTCPAILQRLERDLRLIGAAAAGWEVPKPAPRQVIAAGQGDLFLEEFRFTQQGGLPTALMATLERFGAENLNEQLVIMHNDDFAWFARNATAVTPHIAIDSATKVVKHHMLWYEESLPPDTLLYTMLMGADAHVASVLQMFAGDSPFIQIGGNETVGMGWCKVTEATG